MCTPCAQLPAPRLMTGTGRVCARYSRDLRGRHLAQDREAAGVDEGLGVVDHLLRALGGLALRDEAAELGHAHRRDADVALHRDAGLDDRLDVLGVVLVAFALHHFGIGLVHEAAGVLDRLLLGDVEAPVRHVDHAEPEFRAAVDRLRHDHHFVEADCDGALVSEQDHAAGVGHAQDVHAEAIGDDGGAVVVGRELRDRLAFFHLRHQRVDGHFLTLLLGHVFLHGFAYLVLRMAPLSGATKRL